MMTEKVLRKQLKDCLSEVTRLEASIEAFYKVREHFQDNDESWGVAKQSALRALNIAKGKSATLATRYASQLATELV